MNKLIIALAVFLIPISAQLQEIKWVKMGELEAAMKKEPRKIMIDVYTDWCGPCKMMMKNTFTHPGIIKYVNEKYYAVKFNAEGSEEIKFLGKTYRNPSYDPSRAGGRNSTHELTQAIAPVNGRIAYPTIVYMDEQYNILSPVQGYMQPQQIEPILHFFGEEVYQNGVNYQDYQKTFQSKL